MVEDKVKKFFSNYPEKSFYKGDVLIWAHNEPDGIFFIENGSVCQCDISKDGKKIIVNQFKKGAFFPMSWAINKTRNEYFYEATEDLETRFAHTDEVLRFVKNNPDVMYDLLGRVFRGTDGLLEKVSHLMFSDAQTRVLYTMINEYERSQHKEKNEELFVIKLTESELSLRTGLARETVSRQLGKLGKLKLLTVSGGSIKIPNIQKLRSMLKET